MLKLCLLILFFFAAKINTVFSQPQQSNIQAFLHQPDKYVTSEVFDIGKVRDLTIQITKAKNLIDSKTLNGVRLSYKAINSSGKQFGYIDADEIDALINAMEDMNANIFNKEPSSRPTDNFEYHYSCRSGLNIGGFSGFFSGTYGKMTWNQYVMFSETSSDKIIISLANFNELKSILSLAKEKMEAK